MKGCLCQSYLGVLWPKLFKKGEFTVISLPHTTSSKALEVELMVAVIADSHAHAHQWRRVYTVFSEKKTELKMFSSVVAALTSGEAYDVFLVLAHLGVYASQVDEYAEKLPCVIFLQTGLWDRFPKARENIHTLPMGRITPVSVRECLKESKIL